MNGRLDNRIAALEGAPDDCERAVMLLGPDDCEAAALVDYEAQHGPIGEKEPFYIRLVGVDPTN